MVSPVVLPPGRAKLDAIPLPTGSPVLQITTGIVVVTFPAATAAGDPDERRAARAEAERLWPVSADRSLRLRPGVRGGLGTPVKAVLRKAMRWYVEPLAYDQRSFNAAALRLIDDLQEQVDRLEAELAATPSEPETMPSEPETM